MSIECGECERDLRGGHADDCPRRYRWISKQIATYLNDWATSYQVTEAEHIPHCDEWPKCPHRWAPDYFTDEAANGRLLDAMPDPVLWKGGPEKPDWVCHPHHFRHGTQYDHLIAQHPDRKTAVVEAFLKFIEDAHATAKQG